MKSKINKIKTKKNKVEFKFHIVYQILWLEARARISIYSNLSSQI